MNLSEDIAELPSPHCISRITERGHCFGADSRGWNVLVARSFVSTSNHEGTHHSQEQSPSICSAPNQMLLPVVPCVSEPGRLSQFEVDDKIVSILDLREAFEPRRCSLSTLNARILKLL